MRLPPCAQVKWMPVASEGPHRVLQEACRHVERLSAGDLPVGQGDNKGGALTMPVTRTLVRFSLDPYSETC